MRIFISDIRKIKNNFSSALCRLTPARRLRVERLLKMEDKLRCAAAGLLLRQILNVTDDEQLVYGPYGKPSLKSGHPFFSLAHSGDYALLSVGDCPHGIDIEQAEHIKPELARRCLTDKEYEFFLSSDEPDELFSRLWTGKESIMKATGLGFSLAPKKFSLLPLDLIKKQVMGSEWFLYQQKFAEYQFSLAASEKIMGRIDLTPLP